MAYGYSNKYKCAAGWPPPSSPPPPPPVCCSFSRSTSIARLLFPPLIVCVVSNSFTFLLGYFISVCFPSFFSSVAAFVLPLFVVVVFVDATGSATAAKVGRKR